MIPGSPLLRYVLCFSGEFAKGCYGELQECMLNGMPRGHEIPLLVTKNGLTILLKELA